MLETYGLYASELTDEERELGFEIVELDDPGQQASQLQDTNVAVVNRFRETDRIAKMNVPVIGGYSYRHERLAGPVGSNANPKWMPVGSVVFPTAEQALNSVGSLPKQLQLCH